MEKWDENNRTNFLHREEWKGVVLVFYTVIVETCCGIFIQIFVSEKKIKSRESLPKMLTSVFKASISKNRYLKYIHENNRCDLSLQFYFSSTSNNKHFDNSTNSSVPIMEKIYLLDEM